MLKQEKIVGIFNRLCRDIRKDFADAIEIKYVRVTRRKNLMLKIVGDFGGLEVRCLEGHFTFDFKSSGEGDTRCYVTFFPETALRGYAHMRLNVLNSKPVESRKIKAQLAATFGSNEPCLDGVVGSEIRTSFVVSKYTDIFNEHAPYDSGPYRFLNSLPFDYMCDPDGFLEYKLENPRSPERMMRDDGGCGEDGGCAEDGVEACGGL